MLDATALLTIIDYAFNRSIGFSLFSIATILVLKTDHQEGTASVSPDLLEDMTLPRIIHQRGTSYKIFFSGWWTKSLIRGSVTSFSFHKMDDDNAF